MLLVIDVGNTNTVLGLFEGAAILHDWRIETRKGRTADELGLLIQGLFRSQGRDVASVTATAISSVVPSMRRTLEQACRRYLGVTPMVVGPGIKTGMAILMDNPREVGADRIVNAVAAWERYKQPLVVVDFGTATTFDCVSHRGEYMGGIIAPGYQISAEALFRQTSKLPRVDLTKPKRVIGKNTIGGMQSGLFYGYVGLVDGLVRRVLGEMGRPAKVVATGGLALLFAEASETLDAVEAHLTLHGLRIIWERNREA